MLPRKFAIMKGYKEIRREQCTGLSRRAALQFVEP